MADNINQNENTNQNDNKENIEEIDCREIILSEEYADAFVEYNQDIEGTMKIYNAVCYQIINEKFAAIHYKLTEEELAGIVNFEILPRVYGPYGRDSLSEAGILPFHTQPYVPLRGNGVIIGFIDSGIDYTQPVFKYEDNTTKIISIWDQTIQDGNPPDNFLFGTEYSAEEINKALTSDNPYEIVPSIDETGHGTAMAGIAAGREVGDYIGAAPEAELVIVKLKQVKQFLKNIYLINEGAIVYQSIDVMLGINYLMQKATLLNRPLVICVGLGSNIGGHDGTEELEQYLDTLSFIQGYSVVVAVGDEADLGHHYLGEYKKEMPFQDVELKVAENERGFLMRMVVTSPDLYTIGIISPTGEYISRVPLTRESRIITYKFLLEKTVINIVYYLFWEASGDQYIVVRFKEPTVGIWTIRVFGEVVVEGEYHIWIDRKDWINEETRFLRPNPFTTITVPSTSFSSIGVGVYNQKTTSISVSSGRGFTTDAEVKPD